MADLVIRLNIALGFAILLAIAVRKPTYRWFGPGAAYMVWLLAPLAALAVFLPPRTVEIRALDQAVATERPASAPGLIDALQTASPSIASGVDVGPVFAAVWLTGFAAALGLLIWRHLLFYRLARPLAPVEGDHRLRRSANPRIGPALVGLFRPTIILPADFELQYSPRELTVMIAHERAHLQRGDLQINILVALTQCVFWYNPLVHLAARLLRIDQELACDQAVILQFPHARRTYAEALLKSRFRSASSPVVCQWTPGAGALKARIAMLVCAPKPKALRWVGFGAVLGLGLGAAAAVWATQPPSYRGIEAVGGGRAAPAPFTPETAEFRAAFREIVAERSGAGLLASVTSVETYGPTGGERLVSAVQGGDGALVQRLVEEGAAVDLGAFGQGSPLIAAVRRRDRAMVRLLLALGADPNLGAIGDGNPLILATRYNLEGVAEDLIRGGAKVDTIVPADETALITAAREGSLGMVQLLVRHGADVNKEADTYASDSPEVVSPLGVAERAGHRDVAGYLRSVGARS